MTRRDIIEVIGLVAIVMSLLLVWQELKLSKLVTQNETFRARAAEMSEANQVFATSEYLPGIYDQIEKEGVESLDSIQLRRVVAWETNLMTRVNSIIRQYEMGFSDEATLHSVLNRAAAAMPLWEALDMNVFSNILEALDDR